MAYNYEHIVDDIKTTLNELQAGNIDSALESYLTAEAKAQHRDNSYTPTKDYLDNQIERNPQIREVTETLKKIGRRLQNAGNNAAMIRNFEVDMRPRLFSTLEERLI